MSMWMVYFCPPAARWLDFSSPLNISGIDDRGSWWKGNSKKAMTQNRYMYHFEVYINCTENMACRRSGNRERDKRRERGREGKREEGTK